MFLDIQMPGLSGFDVLAELQPHELPMIVFVTAYDRFAVQAFEARAIDYVLKPVDDARLAATLTHVRELVEQRTAVAERNQLVNLLAELRGSGEIEAGDATTASQTPNWLPIRNGRETVRVPVERSSGWTRPATTCASTPAATRTSCAPRCARWRTCSIRACSSACTARPS